MEPADRLSLLWVWASISAASWRVPVAGSRTTSLTPLPPAPRLSLSPPYSIFVPGERVRLTCSPPEGWRAEEFWFYKLKPGDQWDLQLRQKEGTWELEVSTAHLEPQTTFVCTYSVGKSAGELLQSAQSNLCPVSILELPPAALSLDPKYPIYLQEEGVTLTCSALEGRQVSGYLFYKEEPDRSLRELPHTGRGPYEAFNVSRSTAGKYSCAYWVLLSGREIPSPYSSPISVAVTDEQVLVEGWMAPLTLVALQTHGTNVDKHDQIVEDKRLQVLWGKAYKELSWSRWRRAAWGSGIAFQTGKGAI